MSGYVYVVSNCSGHYKIGRTNNVESRIRAIQTSNPSSIELIVYFHSDDNVSLEKELHCLFSSKRVNGEWFMLDNNDIDLLKSRDKAILGEHKKPMFYIRHDALFRIATNENLTPDSKRVFAVLIKNLSIGNIFNISQKEISDELAIDEQRVSRGIKILRDNEIIKKEVKKGKIVRYYLSKEYGQKEMPHDFNSPPKKHSYDNCESNINNLSLKQKSESRSSA